MGRKAFLDTQTNVLKSHGFVETNEVGDLIVEVPEDFRLISGKWLYQNTVWQVHPNHINDPILYLL